MKNVMHANVFFFCLSSINAWTSAVKIQRAPRNYRIKWRTSPITVMANRSLLFTISTYMYEEPLTLSRQRWESRDRTAWTLLPASPHSKPKHYWQHVRREHYSIPIPTHRRFFLKAEKQFVKAKSRTEVVKIIFLDVYKPYEATAGKLLHSSICFHCVST